MGRKLSVIAKGTTIPNSNTLPALFGIAPPGIFFFDNLFRSTRNALAGPGRQSVYESSFAIDLVSAFKPHDELPEVLPWAEDLSLAV